MKTKNKIGPSTDPCGTPEVTVTCPEACTSFGNAHVNGCAMKKNSVDPYEV